MTVFSVASAYDQAMERKPGKVHVVRVSKTGYVDKQGGRRDYSSAYLRRTYRDGGKVRNETVANLSALPDQVIDWIDAGLKGQHLVAAGEAFTIIRSLPHGHVAAVAAMARTLGLPALLGPAGRQRDLVLALIISRVARPGSKLSTLTWWADTTLGADLGVADASTDEIYAAMDWLGGRQDAIEATLARRHLAPGVNTARMALFDLTSAWVEGRHCTLAARGYSRDGKKGKAQIEYGLLTDPDGRPVAVRVFAGNTGDPDAFVQAVEVVREKFGLTQMVMVGDRGMITTARIDALQKLDGMGWLTALRAPAIARLAADDGPLQLSLFDEQDLAEISHPDYPGERLVVCRNPLLAAERARKRADLLHVTENLVAPVIARVAAGRLTGAGQIGVALGKVIGKYKVAKHFDVAITDTSLAITRRHGQIDAEAALDGIYVLRTSVTAGQLDAAGAVTAYKNLAHLERDFRSIKADDLDLRPIYHRLEDRVKAHVLLCMLACYLTWHLRRAWAPLTFTDEHPPTRDNPLTPARRSPEARAKASSQHDGNGHPYRSFGGLLDHLATLTRNQVRFAGTQATVPMLTQATADQRHAFDLIGASIPLTLT
jgi:Transposase DDE domain